VTGEKRHPRPEDLLTRTGRFTANRLLAVRETFLNRLWAGMFAVALVGVPFSVLRAYTTGWQPIFNFHIGLGLVATVLYFARNRISYRVKLFTLIGLFWAIGVTGVVSLGLLGSGVWFLVMSSFIVSSLFSLRAGIYTAAAASAVLIAVGLLFTRGVLSIPFDANAYAASLSGWAALLISTAIMPFVVLTAFGAYQDTIVDLLHEVQSQRDQIAELAARDQLTGLPMASLATDRLQMKMQSALRSGTRVALMFIDLNGFKAVNDTYGHEAGDRLLQVLSRRLRESVRAEDTVARVGGDEFLVILGGLKKREEAVPLAEKIVANICRPIKYEQQEIRSGASVGISVFPEDAADVVTLRRLADRAMYQVKRSGRNGHAFADVSVPLSDLVDEG